MPQPPLLSTQYHGILPSLPEALVAGDAFAVSRGGQTMQTSHRSFWERAVPTFGSLGLLCDPLDPDILFYYMYLQPGLLCLVFLLFLLLFFINLISRIDSDTISKTKQWCWE